MDGADGRGFTRIRNLRSYPCESAQSVSSVFDSGPNLVYIVYNTDMAIDMTQAVRIKTVVAQDGVLHLFGPFRMGESVEVIVLSEPAATPGERYPLQGTDYTFVEPFTGAADGEWEALQ